jgi:hypothetical protein
MHYTTGPLYNSCMRYDGLQEAVKSYARIGCRLLVLYDDENAVLARAVIWPDVVDGDQTFTVCDRIFYAEDMKIREAFEQEVEKRGYYDKNDISLNNLRYYGPEPDPDCAPYHDTFIGYDCSLGAYITYESDYTLQETNGTCSDGNRVMLANGDTVPEDEAAFIERYDEYYHIDEVVYSRAYGGYILVQESVEVGGDSYWEDDIETIIYDDIDEEWILLEESVDLQDGRVTHRDNAETCAYYEEWFLEKDMIYDEKEDLYFLDEEARDLYFKREAEAKNYTLEMTHEV